MRHLTRDCIFCQGSRRTAATNAATSPLGPSAHSSLSTPVIYEQQQQLIHKMHDCRATARRTRACRDD